MGNNSYGYNHTPTDADGAFAQDHKIRMSATLEAIADDLAAPGESVNGAYATLVARLAATEALLAQVSHRNLRAQTSSGSVIDVAWDSLSIDGFMAGAFSGSCTITNVGANGRDTSTSLAIQFYYLWAIRNPTSGAISLLFSPSSTAPTMPSGYTQKRLLSDWRNTSGVGAALRRCAQRGNRMFIGAPSTDAAVVSGASATTTAQTPTTTTFFPATTRLATLTGFLTPGTGTDVTRLTVRAKGLGLPGTTGVEIAYHSGGTAEIVRYQRDVAVPLDSNAQFEWMTDVATTGMTATIIVTDYWIPWLS